VVAAGIGGPIVVEQHRRHRLSINGHLHVARSARGAVNVDPKLCDARFSRIEQSLCAFAGIDPWLGRILGESLPKHPIENFSPGHEPTELDVALGEWNRGCWCVNESLGTRQLVDRLGAVAA
jgi:hypothetical protein